MVLANGTVLVASRDDANATVYRAVLGSAPGRCVRARLRVDLRARDANRRRLRSSPFASGVISRSWGVVTQYTLDGVRDAECPFTRACPLPPCRRACSVSVMPCGALIRNSHTIVLRACVRSFESVQRAQRSRRGA